MLVAVTSTIQDFPLFIKKRKVQCDFLRAKKNAMQEKIASAKTQRSKYEFLEIELKINNYRLELLASELKVHGISSRDPMISLQRETTRMRLRARYTELLSSISSYEADFPGGEKLLHVPLEGFPKAISVLLSDTQRKLERRIEESRDIIVRERHELNAMRAQQSLESQEFKQMQNKSDFTSSKAIPIEASCPYLKVTSE